MGTPVPPFSQEPAALSTPVPLSPPPPEYPDRSTGLVVFGIAQIILGLFSILGIPLILLSAVIARKSMGGSMPFGSYVMSIATYALLAAMFITLGVGSIRARRWGWALTLITSWVWLIIGAVMTVLMAVVVPTGFMANMRMAGGGAPPMSRGVIAVILTFVIVFFTFFLVVVPVAFVVFYRRKDVEETCKRRDPVERWTDRCPLPVLAASLLFGFGAVYYLLLSFTTPMMPLFGRFLTGIPGAAAGLLVVALDVYLALSLFRLKRTAWWIAVTVVTLRLVSAVVTFSRGNILEAYSRMGWSQRQLEMASANPAMRPAVMMWMTLALTLPLLGYLIWIKRYFAPPSVTTPIPPEPPPPESLPGPFAPTG